LSVDLARALVDPHSLAEGADHVDGERDHPHADGCEYQGHDELDPYRTDDIGARRGHALLRALHTSGQFPLF
jgi:hypothetical protein